MGNCESCRGTTPSLATGIARVRESPEGGVPWFLSSLLLEESGNPQNSKKAVGVATRRGAFGVSALREPPFALLAKSKIIHPS